MANIYIFFSFLIIIFSNDSLAGAWLVPKGKSQVITQLDLRGYVIKEKDDSNSVTSFNTIDFKVEIERGLSDKYSATYALNTSELLSYRFYLYEKNTGYEKFEKKKGKYVFPYRFKSQQLGLKTNLYRDDFNIISHHALLEHLVGSALALENKIMFGKNFIYMNKDFFLDIGLGYKKGLKRSTDSVKMDLTLGIKTYDKKIHMIQLFSIYQGKYYDPLSNNYVSKKYIENKLQISTAKEIKKGIYIHNSLYGNLNNRKKFSSTGMTFAVWMDI